MWNKGRAINLNMNANKGDGEKAIGMERSSGPGITEVPSNELPHA